MTKTQLKEWIGKDLKKLDKEIAEAPKPKSANNSANLTLSYLIARKDILKEILAKL